MTEALRNPRLPRLLFAGAVGAAAVLLLVLGSKLTFWLDEWDFLLSRRGFDAHAILDPHADHIVVLPVLIYKALLATFGMTSQEPFRVVSVAVFLAGAVLLFVWARRRVGDWLALAGVLPLLFLGTAASDLMWPFQVGYCGSIATGLGALLALERSDRSGDRLACVLLTTSILFGSVGLVFIAGALVDVAWDSRRWRRAYVVVVPSAVYALWWLGWGHEAESFASLHNLATSFGYILDGFASGASSLVGISSVGSEPTLVNLGLGRALLVLILAAAAFRIHRSGGISRSLAIVVSTAFTFWLLAAVNANPLRYATTPRYQLMAAMFIVLIGSELLRGVRLGWKGLVVVFVIAGAATVSNLSLLHQFYVTNAEAARGIRAQLGAVEIARPALAEGGANPTLATSGSYPISHHRAYLSAVDEFGSPAYSPDALASSDARARLAADQILQGALGIGLATAGPRYEARGCTTLQASPSAQQTLSLRSGWVTIAPRGSVPARVRLGRYADGLPLDLGTLPAEHPSLLRLPRDLSPRAWRMGLQGSGSAKVCGPAIEAKRL